MRALVVTCRDPFRPANRRSVDVVKRRRSLRNLAPKTRSPVICQINGQWISRKAWGRKVQDGDSVVFVTLPQGGGGGGSNPLRVVLSLALALIIPGIGATINLALFNAGSSMAFALSSPMLTAIVGVAGSLLVNALVPAPKLPQSQQANALAAPSPTYSLGAQGNSARIGAPIPVIYGRMQIFPDFAAMPYVEYAGNEQYLYQLLCVGQGHYNVEAIRIEDTPISSFPEITYEVVGPGASVTLFPASVTTSSEVAGQEALTGVSLGPFVANASGTIANYLAVDVVMPRGIYYANNAGGLDTVSIGWSVQAQPINNVGAATGGWVTLGSESYSAKTTTPQRLSYKYAVTPGRYQVRLTRNDTKQTDARYGHEIDWTGLRAYLPGAQSYGDVTMVAMRLRATNGLSAQASRKINMIVQRKLKTWHPVTGWSAPVATRSIAWALADICKANYGAGLIDSRVDLSGLYDLNSVWTTRGDNLDCAFDSQSTIMEGLSVVGRTGRAIPYLQGGIVHAVRDAPATIPVALFSQRNIIKNSLTLESLMASEETADCVDVTYFDAQIWGERTVRATLPGSLSEKPAKVDLFGVTTRQQAWNEGMYIAACNRYRRRLLTFATEMEGFIPTVGDLIAVQHDMPKWGQSGEIVAWNPVTKTATLSEPLDWSAGGAHVIAFRQRNGRPAGPYACSAGTDAYHVVIDGWISGQPTPDTGSDRERSHYAFGPSNQQYIRCRMITMRPKSAETVEIAAVVESDFVHVADTGAAPSPSDWQLPSKFTVPEVTDLICRYMHGTPDKMVISWQPAVGADHYLIEQSNGDGTWTNSGETSATSFSAIALYGIGTIVRVAAVGITRGPWVSAVVVPGGSDFAPSPVTGLVLSYTSGLITLTWNPNPESTVKYYSARVGASWAAGNPVGRGLTTISYRITAPGTYVFWVAATNDLGLTSAPVSASITISVPAALTGITVTPGVLNGYFQCNVPPEKDFAGIQIWLATVPSFTPGPSYLVYDGPNTAVVVSKDGAGAALVSGTTYYLKAAAYSLIKTGLLASADYSFVPTAAGGVPVVASYANLPASPADGSVYSVKDNNKLYRYDTATGWITWVDGSDIINASVTAGKITTANLSAISANMGAITAGSITMDAGGFIKGGQSAYNTGTGFWLGYNGGYKFSLGNPATSYLNWDGTNLNIASPQFSLSGGNATFSGSLNAATGTFNGSLAANSVTANMIDSRGLSIKDAAGNVILASGSALATSHNLLNTSTWALGHDGCPGFNRNGGLYEQYRIISDLPDGSTGVSWRTYPGLYYNNAYGWDGPRPGGEPAGDADGGWATDSFPVVSKRGHRFSVWARRYTGSVGAVFLGCGGGTVQNMPSGGVNNNPYFISFPVSSLVVGRWYLFVGYVFPDSDSGTAQRGTGGIYDGTTGAKVGGGTDYCWMPGQTTSSHRTYHYYAAAGSQVDFTWPRVDMLTGSEPSLAQLLAMGNISARNPITAGNISTYIANLAVDTLQIAGQAVTIPVAVNTAAAGYNANTGVVTLASATILSTGAPILATWFPGMGHGSAQPQLYSYGGAAYIQILVNGVANHTLVSFTASTAVTLSSFTKLITASAGAVTISVVAYNPSGYTRVSEGTLSLVEVKR